MTPTPSKTSPVLKMRESAAVERAVAIYMAGGLTITAAAERAGVDRGSLSRALRRRGVPPAPPHDHPFSPHYTGRIAAEYCSPRYPNRVQPPSPATKRRLHPVSKRQQQKEES